MKDFAPITEIASIPLMLVVQLAAGDHVKEFIEYSKTQPGGLDYATSAPAHRRISRPKCSRP